MSKHAGAAPSAANRSGPIDQGPIGFALEVFFGLVLGALFAWAVGVVIEVVAMHVPALWADQGIQHARGLVEEDFRYIAEYPRSVLIADTLAFEKAVANTVAKPFLALGVMQYYEESLRPIPDNVENLKRTSLLLKRELAKVFMVAMYIAMDTAMRLFVIVFALPAFVMACLLGAVDGLVRRDLRKWGGGRESSFVYHRAKKITMWALTGGFALYLAWPFGGFNPAYMVLIFTALVAWSLSVWISTFKKYV